MRTRRLRKHAAEVEVTAFINLIVVLVPFLLSTAVFTRMSVLEVSLPAQSGAVVEQVKGNDLKLEVVIRPDALDVGDRIGGLIRRIEKVDGHYDTQELGKLVQSVKAKFPDTTTATVLAQADTSYDVLVQVMDALRESQVVQGSKILRTPMFPDIAIGDAPVKQR
jgi:biopolymer transport protein ExbD